MGKLENNDVTGEKNFLGQFLPKNQKLDHFDKGIGIVCGDDGTKYIGAFVEGKSSINSGQKHGFGIEINNRDCVYRGFWQYDVKHGEGILTGKKGDQLLQKWEDGKLNSQKKLG